MEILRASAWTKPARDVPDDRDEQPQRYRAQDADIESPARALASGSVHASQQSDLCVVVRRQWAKPHRLRQAHSRQERDRRRGQWTCGLPTRVASSGGLRTSSAIDRHSRLMAPRVRASSMRSNERPDGDRISSIGLRGAVPRCRKGSAAHTAPGARAPHPPHPAFMSDLRVASSLLCRCADRAICLRSCPLDVRARSETRSLPDPFTASSQYTAS